tara:strand:+ start:933 stop:1529 length:597 start_codon:yes stop_codon:yes gene_type:complete
MSYDYVSSQRLNNTLTHIINNQNSLFDMLHSMRTSITRLTRSNQQSNPRRTPIPPPRPARTTFNLNSTTSQTPTEALFNNLSNIELSLTEPINYHILNSIFNPSGELDEPPVSLTNLLENTTIKVFDSSDEEEDLCTICRIENQNNDIIRVINRCGHSFHQTCLDQWLINKHTCPVCRGSLRDNAEDVPISTGSESHV